MKLTKVGKLLEALRHAFSRLPSQPITSLFENDGTRFQSFHLKHEDLIFDYSKTSISKPILSMLHKLADIAEVEYLRDRMFAGASVNETEMRPALHTALRRRDGEPLFVAGNNVTPIISEGRDRFLEFSEKIRSGEIVTPKGKAFRSVISIGIGGSDLGPAMGSIALRPYCNGPQVEFVSNVDAASFRDISKRLDPNETLIIVQSKTFTTTEVLLNLQTAKHWLASSVGSENVSGHLAAVTTASDRAEQLGIQRDSVFTFWDWVGGRYSIWSAIGLPLAIEIGRLNFESFLDGGNSMDQHFKLNPIECNIPIVFGLISLWHRIGCGYATRAIVPYDQRLARLPAYLQQLDMESNGKSICRDGSKAKFPTAPVVWGEPGTNAQHAFFQLLHQGTDIVPIEFIVAAQGHEKGFEQHHETLIANCFAQSMALMMGRTARESCDGPIDPHRQFEGQRPSITILHRKLDPYTLGRLLALYEHRAFVEAAILGINPFDQWGVELGKELSQSLLEMVRGTAEIQIDSSTAGLIAFAQTFASSTISGRSLR